MVWRGITVWRHLFPDMEIEYCKGVLKEAHIYALYICIYICVYIFIYKIYNIYVYYIYTIYVYMYGLLKNA